MSLHRCICVLSWLCLATAQLHLVEPSLVTCPDGPGKAVISLPEKELDTDREFEEYMLSFFFKADGPVTIDYSVVDAKNTTVIEKQTLHLRGAETRRLDIHALKTIQDIWSQQQMIDIAHGAEAASALNGAEKCIAGDWEGSCVHCLDDHEPQDCQVLFSPPANMSRYDAKGQPFKPGMYYFPLKLIITRIQGETFSESKICTEKKASKKALGEDGSVFVLLSEVDYDADTNTEIFQRHPVMTAVLIATGCLCCCGIFGGLAYCFIVMKKRNDEYDQLMMQGGGGDSPARSLSR